MNLTLHSIRRLLGIAGLAAAPVILSACSEKLESTAACPLACSGETSDILNDTLDIITIDTAVNSSYGLGADLSMLLASRGDTVDSRVILRFDSLPRRVRVSLSDTITNPISFIDSAYVRFRLDSGAVAVGQPVTINVYDVSMTSGNDTSVASLEPLFTASRLVGSKTFDPFTVADTVSIELLSSYVLDKISSLSGIRLGIQIVSSESVSARMYSSATGAAPYLTMRISPDYAIPATTVVTQSYTPQHSPGVANNLSDFALFVKIPPPAPANLLVVGGLPGQRTYLRFDLPRKYLDSAIVIRATLLLTQIGDPNGPDATDSMRVVPLLGIARPTVTDIERAAQITAPTSGQYQIVMDTVRTAPGDNRTVAVEIAPVFGIWRAQADTLLPRAIILQDAQEDGAAARVLFYPSSEAVASRRPKLRISYTLRNRIGTP